MWNSWRDFSTIFVMIPLIGTSGADCRFCAYNATQTRSLAGVLGYNRWFTTIRQAEKVD
jgi:hypothetical protein